MRTNNVLFTAWGLMSINKPTLMARKFKLTMTASPSDQMSFYLIKKLTTYTLYFKTYFFLRPVTEQILFPWHCRSIDKEVKNVLLHIVYHSYSGGLIIQIKSNLLQTQTSAKMQKKNGWSD